MSAFFVEDDDGRRLDDDEVQAKIRSAANGLVYTRPIHLFDTSRWTVITREEYAEQLIEAVVNHVSTPPIPEDVSSRSESAEDPSAGRVLDDLERANIPRAQLADNSSNREDLKAGHDRALMLRRRNFYRPSDIYHLIYSYSRYAILSHRWSKNELLFSDIPTLDDMKTRKPEGYRKFTSFARVVKDRDPLCHYLWIDTLCIDKTSSAELDESIRSMYNWYKISHFCVVHLAQTRSSDQLADDPWFTRGWTLQELLAPLRIKFYTFDWSEAFPSTEFDIDRGRGSRPNILQSIAHAAVMRSEYSEYIQHIFTPSPHLAPLVFSWAARRQTSRPEDTAYCLIGLLKVHLPIAYGEGKDSAFGRLQFACIQSSPSRGLFLWRISGSSSANSMLAEHPSVFPSPTCDIRCDTVAGFNDMDFTFSLTNGVLRIKMWLLPVRSPNRVEQNIHGSLFDPDDFQVERPWQMDSALDGFEKGTLVVGVLGFHGETMHAVILSKEHGCWLRAPFFYITQLPSKSDLERSGVKPQRILIK